MKMLMILALTIAPPKFANGQSSASVNLQTSGLGTAPKTASANLDYQFVFQKDEADCDIPETQVVETISEQTRQATQALNRQARQLCRFTFEQHRTEYLNDAQMNQAVSLQRQADELRAMPPPSSPSDEAMVRQSRIALEKSLAEQARTHRVEACEVREATIFEEELHRGDTLGAMIEQSKIKGDICRYKTK